MKNRSLFLAAAATVASGAALAQSNVTVYGRLNVSVERQKFESTIDQGEGDFVTNSASIWALQNSASRIGVKGSEDLGGGLKASFQLEHGFSADTGAQSQSSFWGRASWVGLEGSFGRVRLGNMGATAAYFSLADYISNHNHDTGTSGDALYLFPGGVFPFGNAIAYNTPNIGGFSGEVQIALKETTAAGSKNATVLAGNYDAGPLHVAAAYVSANQSFAGVSGTGKEFGVRGLYEMGPLVVGAYFINNKIDDAGGNDLKRNLFRVSAMYTLGAGEFHVNVGKAGKLKVGGTTIDDSAATQYTLAYNYNLSKRTKVYTFYTGVSGDGREFYTTLKNSLAFGLRHNF